MAYFPQLHGSKFQCKFSTVWEDILIRVHNLWITYPDRNIMAHTNDVKSCFHQIKHHPDVVGAFSYILAEYLFVQFVLAFSSDFSPANWEAVHRVQSALAECLFFYTSLITKHHTTLNKITWCRSVHGHHHPHFTSAVANAPNLGVLCPNGTPQPTPHGVYVDDDIYLNVADQAHFEQATAASIEAVFILLGKPNLTHHQDPVSQDKLLDSCRLHQ